MKILNPFIPVTLKKENLDHRVDVIGRSYTFAEDGMLKSIISDGEEILSGPIRIVTEEDGKEPVFFTDYQNNESASFVYSHSDEMAVICGCMQTQRFVYNIKSTVEFDGNIDIDFKVMTRGRTVKEEFGLSKMEPLKYILNRLWLEIPLKKEVVAHYHMYPNGDVYKNGVSIKAPTRTTSSGDFIKGGFELPFKPIFWLGNEKRGFGFFADADKGWQYENENKAIEVIDSGKEVVLRIHLLDFHPKAWNKPAENGAYEFFPLEFKFGFHATPIKPFPDNPYLYKGLHIDCGIKTKGDYIDFLAENNRYDRLKEKGVDTLFLHEKWNKSQNCFDISEFTQKQIKTITEECHKRNIKVMVYFGYEISSINSDWEELSESSAVKDENGNLQGGWWRVPYQRAYKVCYKSSYADKMVSGVAELMDNYNIDGIYLDTTACPWLCCNTNHGCGYYDEEGKLHGTYPVKAIRRLFKGLWREVKKRGGLINIHSSGILNFTMLGFIDSNWVGENLQSPLMSGNKETIDFEYFRAEYTGRNMGVPVEYLAYENRPIWTFDEALSGALVHGILPRPNDIEYPLELMSKVWKIFDLFPIGKSKWNPYWSNNVCTSSEQVKVSYYEYVNLMGEKQFLAFVANMTGQEACNVAIDFKEDFKHCFDLMEEKECSFPISLSGYGYKILYIS